MNLLVSLPVNMIEAFFQKKTNQINFRKGRGRGGTREGHLGIFQISNFRVRKGR